MSILVSKSAARNRRLVLLAALAACQWAWLPKAVPELRGGDFGIFYRSAASSTPYVADSINPTTSTGEPLPNLNPPHFLLVFKPLTWLPLSVASAIWWTVSFGLVVCGLTWWLRSQGERWTAERIVWALLWMPVLTIALTGQVTAVVGVPLWLAYRNLTDGREWRGGLWAGVAMSIKPILWPLGAWYLMRRAWPALAGMIVGACSMVAVGIVAYGVEMYREWIGTLAAISWGPETMNTSVRAIMARFPVAMPQVIWISAAIGIVLWTVWRTKFWEVNDSWFPLMAASLLASPLGWIHYGTWLLPGTRLAAWTGGVARGWCVPVLVVASLGNLNPVLWATVGSCYGWTLLALWWRSLGPLAEARQTVVPPMAREELTGPARAAERALA
jgi:Glycosyltransferase family 87